QQLSIAHPGQAAKRGLRAVCVICPQICTARYESTSSKTAAPCFHETLRSSSLSQPKRPGTRRPQPQADTFVTGRRIDGDEPEKRFPRRHEASEEAPSLGDSAAPDG